MGTSYYKKGARVIFHYKELRKVMWSESGYAWVREWKRATLVEPPRDEHGRFTNCESDMEFMKLMDENGKVYFVESTDDVEPDRNITDLSRKELVKLWGQIRRGSGYYVDYRNSLGVFENTAMACYEGFWAYLVDEYGEERAEIEDTAENFADYVDYYMMDCA